jgi:hypothetical protein
MTVYRAIMGTAETIGFMVPQPGYYDPMVDPEFVWHDWEPKRAEYNSQSEQVTQKEQ